MEDHFTAILTFPDHDQVMILRKSLITICSGDQAQAAVLNQMTYWTPRAHDPDGWIYKSAQEMTDELLGFRSHHIIADAFKGLVARGFLVSRHNPKHRYDRTLQYRVEVAVVQAAIDGTMPIPIDAHDPIDGVPRLSSDGSSIDQKWSMEDPNPGSRIPITGQAIPKITLEVTSEITNTDTALASSRREEVIDPDHTNAQGDPLPTSATSTAPLIAKEESGTSAKTRAPKIAKPDDVLVLLEAGEKPWLHAKPAYALYLAYLHARDMARQHLADNRRPKYPHYLSEASLAVGDVTPEEFHAATLWLTRELAAVGFNAPRPAKVIENLDRWRATKPKILKPKAALVPIADIPEAHRHRYCPSFWESLFEPGFCTITEEICANLLQSRFDAVDLQIVTPYMTGIRPIFERNLRDRSYRPDGYVYDPAEFDRIAAAAALLPAVGGKTTSVDYRSSSTAPQ